MPAACHLYGTMKNHIHKLILSIAVLLVVSPVFFPGGASAGESEDIKQRIEYLENELKAAREKLAESEPQAASEEAAPAAPEKSPVRIGGAMRANWAYGDYAPANRRSKEIGDVDLELLRLDMDIDYNGIIGRAEYRYYNDYGMLKDAWLGFKTDDYGTVKAGIVRVPFGPSPWGVSTSWFFDQHYYLGLSDDMDLGVRWSKPFGDLTVDVAYYLQDEGDWDGESSLDSARYSYDPVRWRTRVYSGGEVVEGETKMRGDTAFNTDQTSGFEEKHQFNLRLIYAIESFGDLGTSFQYGKLKGTNVDDDGAYHLAASGHARNSLWNFTLYSQVTYYKYNITDDTPWGTGDLIPMGAFDFAWPVASKGVIPAFSLRYDGINTSNISWLDGVTPYVEWSSVIKDRNDFNDSQLWTFGALWSWGGMYIYTELGLSSGNFFVGGEGDDYGNIYNGINHVGANGNDRWHKRFNINVGYYFDLFK